jgi:hypothetical protein
MLGTSYDYITALLLNTCALNASPVGRSCEGMSQPAFDSVELLVNVLVPGLASLAVCMYLIDCLSH